MTYVPNNVLFGIQLLIVIFKGVLVGFGFGVLVLKCN